MCYTKYVSFVEFFRKICVYNEICAKILRGIEILKIMVKLNPSTRVILFILPEAEGTKAEGIINDITQVNGIYLASIPVYNT